MKGFSTKDAKDMFGIIEKVWRKIKTLDIIGQELTLRVPENVAEYTVTIDVHRHRPLSRKLTFPVPEILGIKINSIPTLASENQAVLRGQEGLEIHFSNLSKNADTLLFSFECIIPNTRFIDNLVQRNVEREASSLETREYWLHAQLKYVEALRTRYGRLDVRNLDLLVNVGVYQEIKTSIPFSLIRELEVIRDWIRTTDRERKFKLDREHLKISRMPGHREVHDMLTTLQEIFLPKNFESFIEVMRPFYYSDCARGTMYFDIPYYSLPKTMNVIARTNLSLDIPAAEGKLIYKKDNIKNEISGVIGKRKKRKRAKKSRAR